MINREFIDQITEKLTEVVPQDLKVLKEDLEDNFRDVLQTQFTKMNLVSREEFDVQAAVLAKTRKQLDELSERLQKLEKTSAADSDDQKS